MVITQVSFCLSFVLTLFLSIWGCWWCLLQGQPYQYHCFLFSVFFALTLQQFFLLFSHSVVSDSLQPHGLQHTRLPCPSLTPRACLNSCSLSQWCIQPSHPLSFPSLPPSIFPSIFSNESALHMRWPKYWSFSFSISPSNEHPGLISFRMDWLD